MAPQTFYQKLQFCVIAVTLAIPGIYFSLTLSSISDKFTHCYHQTCGHQSDYIIAYHDLPADTRPRAIDRYNAVTVPADFWQMIDLLVIDDDSHAVLWTTYPNNATSSIFQPTVAFANAVRSSLDACNERVAQLHESPLSNRWSEETVLSAVLIAVAINYATAAFVGRKEPSHTALRTSIRENIVVAIMAMVAVGAAANVQYSIETLQPFQTDYRVVTLPLCEYIVDNVRATCKLSFNVSDPPSQDEMRTGMRVACRGATDSTTVGLYQLIVFTTVFFACLIGHVLRLWMLNNRINNASKVDVGDNVGQLPAASRSGEGDGQTDSSSGDGGQYNLGVSDEEEGLLSTTSNYG